MYFTTTYKSPMGKISLACDENQNLVGLWFEGQKYFQNGITLNNVEKNELEIFKLTKTWLDDYFKGKKPEISRLPLSPQGSDFQKRVWQILCKIPYGKVITYGEIAKIIASELNKTKMSAQAVGGAVGHNPISIIIPCHRVVGKNNNLVGYAGGIETKITLLKHENVDTDKFFILKS